MTNKEMIAVMQGYEDGKTIQCSYAGENDWKTMQGDPIWNWYDCDYRIKPEEKYVPYDNISEVERDKWIKDKALGRLYRIIGLYPEDNTVRLYYGGCTLKGLFEGYTYEDGTPCGKKVEE